MFEKFLKRSNWTDIVIAIIFVILGLLFIVKPGEMLSVVSILLGAIFIIIGVLKWIDYFTSKDKEDYLLTMALIFVIFGVIILFCTDIIAGIFRVIIGLWIIIAGIRDFQTALAWKNVKSGLWTCTLVLSMLMIIAGIAVLVSSTLALQVMGVIIAVYGMLDIITRFIFIKKVKNYLDE